MSEYSCHECAIKIGRVLGDGLTTVNRRICPICGKERWIGRFGQVAQPVEQRTEVPCVASSTLALGTTGSVVK